MREILFKAKRTDTREWVEGYIYRQPPYIQMYGISQWWIHIPPVDPDDRGDVFDVFNVDPETVGQYTGLIDKNGKKVFIGDIVRCSCGCPHEVIWADEYVGKYLGGMPAVYLSRLTPGYAWSGSEEVIGNIHDKEEMK